METSLYSFVLVDDEGEIREGMRNAIPWEELGFSFAGACSNGFEALELAERIRPDVVMTDINMPFLDGLSFTSTLLDLSPLTKVLIISGYDDFDYARRALQLKVYDYIVKPVTPAEFREVLVKLRKTLDGERAARRDLEQIRKQLAESLPLIRERFLVQLVEGKLKPPVIAERAAYFGLPLPLDNAAFNCLTVDFIRRREGENFDIDLLTLRNSLEQVLGQGPDAPGWMPPGLVFRDGADRLVMLIWGENAPRVYQEGLKSAEFLHRRLTPLGLGELSLGIGEAAEGVEALAPSYHSSVEALSAALLRGKGGVSAYREVLGRVGKGKGGEARWGQLMASAFRVGAREEAERHIAEMAAYFRKIPLSLDEYHGKLRLTLASILQALEDMEIPQAAVFSPSSDPFAEIQGLKNLDEVEAWFRRLALAVDSHTKARQENFARVKVREALDHMERCYADMELSLQGLCKKLDISMSYFSAVIKKYHGKTFVEELTDIRMRKAMELLKTTDLMTYEIAGRVGYRDAHYFSLCFRKYAGLTSTEYRNSQQGADCG